MKDEKVTLRNVALASHAGAGKTSLSEAILYLTGVTDRVGKVEESNTLSDYDPEEIRRRTSINLSLLPFSLNGIKVNLLDLPGFDDFVGEIKSGLKVSDGLLLLLSGISGVEVGTEKIWGYAQDYELPLFFFINKMEREGSTYFKNLEQLRNLFGSSIVPLVVPIGEGNSFTGVIDLLTWETFDIPKGKEEKASLTTESVKKEYGRWREMLVERLAELDDELLTKYLEGEELEISELNAALEKGVRERRVFPVLAGSAFNLSGIKRLLYYIKNFPESNQKQMAIIDSKTGEKNTLISSPEKLFSAFVFKTIADPYVGQLNFLKIHTGRLTPDTVVLNSNKGKEEKISQLYRMRGKNQFIVEEAIAGDIVIVAKLQDTTTNDTLCDKGSPVLYEPISYPPPMVTVAIRPKSKGDEDKLSGALQRVLISDPTLKVSRDSNTNQVLIIGMGDIHVETVVEKLQSKFGAKVILEEPKIPYQETVKIKVESEYKHKKQTGGRGQYGHVFIRIEPLARGGGFIFDEELFGGSVPKNYVPSVEKGVKEALLEGVLAGFPIVDIKVVLYDGSYHEVDSSDISFKIAGQMALKRGMQRAKPVILEPVMKLIVTVPDKFMGDVISDLNTRRARILGFGEEKNFKRIESFSPMSEILHYGAALRSVTQGRGSYVQEFSHYEEVPALVQEKIIAEHGKKIEEEES